MVDIEGLDFLVGRFNGIGFYYVVVFEVVICCKYVFCGEVVS